jgi:hypothetical protein
MGDVQLGVELRRREGRAQPGEHERVDRARVGVALEQHAVAGVGQGEQRHVVALRRAVDEEPRAPRPPRLGGESLRLGERRRLHAHVDAPHQARDVEREGALAERVVQPRVGTRPALVAGHVQARRVALGPGAEGVEVGRVGL